MYLEESKPLSHDKKEKLIEDMLKNKSYTQSLSPETIIEICNEAQKVINNQPLLIELYSPINIIGSIHGHYENLLEFFRLAGKPGSSNYLFLGNYVDKGSKSLEVFVLLMLYKISYPNIVYLLRGNHESASMSQIYDFYEECLKKTNLAVWKSICQVFNVLPYACIVEGKIFCVHGGISPLLNDPKQILKLERKDIKRNGGLESDLVWSEPSYSDGFEESSKGVGYSFGISTLENFLLINNLDILVRSNQVLEEGYQISTNQRVISLFSASDFQGKYGNSAAMLTIRENYLYEFQVYRPNMERRVLRKIQVNIPL